MKWMKCKNCQNELQDSFKFCPSCGEEVNKIPTCPSCKNQVKSEWALCPFCGSQLKSSAKQQEFSRPMHQQPQQYPNYPPHYEHGYHHGSSSPKRRRKKGFLGGLFSS
jgi:RNA polymerase subunit RPABC4/transcription elongation factor Spt4